VTQFEEEQRRAIQNERMVAEKKKQKRKIIRSLIIAAVLIGIVVLYFCGVKKELDADDGMERNVATDETIESPSGKYSAYADIISFEVEYVVEESTYKHDVQIGDAQTTHFICKCTTIEETEFWMIIPTHAYSGTFASRGKKMTEGNEGLYFDEPIRVHGNWSLFKNVVDNAPSYLSDTSILYVDGSYASID